MRALRIEANHTAPRQQRNDARYAQLHGFLNRVIRAFASAYALSEPHMHRRLLVHIPVVAGANSRSRPLHLFDGRGILATPSVEERQFRPGLQTQHARQMAVLNPRKRVTLVGPQALSQINSRRALSHPSSTRSM